VSEVPNAKGSMKPKKTRTREERYYYCAPSNPSTPPMCLLVHVWAASERYHNQVGNIIFAFSYGVANSAASLNYNPSQTVKNTKTQVNPTPKTNK
jgi:hypothetical protein